MRKSPRQFNTGNGGAMLDALRLGESGRMQPNLVLSLAGLLLLASIGFYATSDGKRPIGTSSVGMYAQYTRRAAHLELSGESRKQKRPFGSWGWTMECSLADDNALSEVRGCGGQ